MKGKFITLEGTEGVGKSTNIRCIEECLTTHGIDFVTSREPGGTDLGEKIRALLLDHRSGSIDAVAELLLIFAARAQHLSEKILPALNSGVWVLCDRFTEATFAYQGSGRGLPIDSIQTLANLVQGTLLPDLTLVLDIDPRLGLARVDARGERDRFEEEDMLFFDRVRQGYLQQIAEQPERFCLINAGQTAEQVTADVAAALNNFVAKC